MKVGREFAVPLSAGALAMLNRVQVLFPESLLVFPSRTGGPLPRNAPGRVVRRTGLRAPTASFGLTLCPCHRPLTL